MSQGTHQTCPRCQVALVDPQDAPRRAFDFGRHVEFCESCVDVVNNEIAEGSLHWYVSHVDPLHIGWSSNASLVRPSPKPTEPRDPVAEPGVLDGDDGSDIESHLDAATRALEGAKHVLVIAGAGMSCDSGLPDFRGKKGYYRVGDDEVKMEDINFHEEHANVDITLTWWYIASMMTAIRRAEPHQGYHILRKFLGGGSGATRRSQRKKDWFVLTSNIDGFFPKAKYSDKRVFECHGSLDYLQCSTYGSADWTASQQSLLPDSGGLDSFDELGAMEHPHEQSHAQQTTTEGGAPKSNRRKRALADESASSDSPKKRSFANDAALSAVRKGQTCDAVWEWPQDVPVPPIQVKVAY